MTALDAVRNPNFGAAMAQQDYFNNLSRLIAERNARGPEYGLMPIGGTGITEEQKQRLSPDERRNLEQAIAMRQRGLDRPISQNPTPPNLMPIGNTGVTGGSAYNQIPPMSTSGTALPPEFFNLAPAYDVSKLISDYQAQKDAPRLMPIGQFSPEQIQNLSPDRRQALEQRMAIEQFQRNLPNQMPVDGQNAIAYQRNADGSLVPVQAPKPIQGDYQTIGRPVGVQPNLPSNFIGQVPQNAQMQNYNNFLQQGIQNSNTMNQGAMANFANMQPGMQAPQQARVAAPSQAMSVAGAGMQQLGQAPTPRKLSTFNNTPARFG